MTKTSQTTQYQWTADRIADGILTWHMWPGFQGTHCRVCKCEMNVQGMSYDHWCPECEDKAKKKDPDFRHYVMCSMHNEGWMPHEQPKFGPTQATIRDGSSLAMKISESRRPYAIGTRVMIREHCHDVILTGDIVEWDVENSYPGMRYYRVDVGKGSVVRPKLVSVLESNIAPWMKFSTGDMVSVRHQDGWVQAQIVRLVNPFTSHFIFRRHWYKVKVLMDTGVIVNGSPFVTSMIHKSVFHGSVREEDIGPDVNPKCRWCKGSGQITLATSIKKCNDCWTTEPEKGKP